MWAKMVPASIKSFSFHLIPKMNCTSIWVEEIVQDPGIQKSLYFILTVLPFGVEAPLAV